jgi:hypothetical protein
MNFDQSTQAKYWMFDRDSLLRCKQDALLVTSLTKERQSSKIHAKSFACGYQERPLEAPTRAPCMPLHTSADSDLSATMATCDQDILVHFHSHQIQRLVGPNAIFPELRRSASVLSTAIMLFRRFYLSNSVIDFHPRNIAAASALLAVKVDCERNLEVSLQIILLFSVFAGVIQYTCLWVVFRFFMGTAYVIFMLVQANIPNVGGESSKSRNYYVFVQSRDWHPLV